MSLQRLNDQEGELYDHKFDLEEKIFENLAHLIHAKWDAPTLKFDLVKFLTERDRIQENLYDVWDKIKDLEDKK